MRHASRMILAPDRQTMQAVLHWYISFHGVELGHTAHIVEYLVVHGSTDPSLRHKNKKSETPEKGTGLFAVAIYWPLPSLQADRLV
jgi:hypothetical protein